MKHSVYILGVMVILCIYIRITRVITSPIGHREVCRLIFCKLVYCLKPQII